jgi:molybdate transport system regulatory protein
MAKLQPGPRQRRTSPEDMPPGVWRGRLRLWIDISGCGAVGPGKLRLLDAIAATKSLSAAARKLRMSYRLAWKHLQLIEERTGLVLVERQRGGRSGGGTDLTQDGQALLQAYRDWRSETDEHMQAAFRRHFARWTGADQAGSEA